MYKLTSLPVLAALLLSACGADTSQDTSQRQRAAAAPCPAWSSTQVYTAGTCAIYQDKQFEAKWWVQGTAPNAADAWGPWKVIADATTPPDPGPGPDPQPGGVPTRAQAETREAELTNNEFFRKVKASVRTLDNAAVEAVTPGAAANPVNVNSESPENQAAVLKVIGNGFDYTPSG